MSRTEHGTFVTTLAGEVGNGGSDGFSVFSLCVDGLVVGGGVAPVVVLVITGGRVFGFGTGAELCCSY